MIAAGLLARNAVERGLDVPAYVKTSLAPGSRVVTEYLEASGLLPYLEDLGYNVVGYGCTTCIGNAGPLPEPIERAIDAEDLWTTSVLSGNRNFEARIHPKIRANYLASPPLVVAAYGLAGRMDIDLEHDPLGTDADGDPVYLADIWPDADEIHAAVHDSVDSSMFEEKYASVFEGTNAGRHSMRRPVRSTSGTTLRRTSASRPSSRTSRWKSPVSQISTTPAR